MTLLTLPLNGLCIRSNMSFIISEKKNIDEMCKRITSVGLLNPLTVSQEKGRYLIIDGKKRYCAIKKLMRANRLPRSLNKIPCILNDKTPLLTSAPEKPLLLSEQDLAHQILRADARGATYPEICALLDCSETVITRARALKHLHPKLMLAFMNEAINLAQAAAFSTLPNQAAQWALLSKLGPFATEPQIIEAIASGETVLNLPNGEIMILPSRTPLESYIAKIKSQQHQGLQLAA